MSSGAFNVVGSLIASLAIVGATSSTLSGQDADGVKDAQKAAPAGPRADLVGLSITLADPENEYGGSAVFGRQAGVEVNLRIVDKAAFFIGLAEDASTLALFTDDGNELENDDQFGGFGFGTNISDDGHRVTVPYSVSGLPPAGANKLHLRGKIVLTSAQDAATAESTFEAKPGVETTLGAVPVKISAVEPDSWGEGGQNLTFETNRPLDAIQEIVFLDENGVVIESSRSGSGSFGFGDQMTYSQNYSLKTDAKTLTARVKYFKAVAEVEIPIDLPVTLSLRM